MGSRYRDRGHNDYDRRNRDRGYGGDRSFRGDRGFGEKRDFGGATHLARIHGTEEDRVNCPFYFKIGACRHGDGCSRMHNKPVFSQTVIVPHMYDNPLISQDALAQYQAFANQKGYFDQKPDEDFEDFYIDVFEELSKYGEIEEMIVCDNLCEHLLGNVYIKYFDEEDAQKCQEGLNGRFFAGRKLQAEFSPVTDFREARCRQYHDNHCTRNGDCNFIHTKRVGSRLVDDLMHLQKYCYKRSNPEKYKYKKKQRKRAGSEVSSDSDDSKSSASSASTTSSKHRVKKRRRDSSERRRR